MALTIPVEGELEIGTVEQLHARVREAVESGERDLVLDLEPTTFIDSTGLAALIAAARDAALDDATVQVHAPPGHEARLLIELTGVAGVLRLTPA
jgi:anti-anti-sigma factor